MQFASHSQAAPVRPSGRPAWRRSALVLLVILVTLGGVAGVAAANDQHAADPAVHAPAAPAGQGEPAQPAHGEAAEHGEAEHAEGMLPTIARIFNFALLAGVLFYFLRTPIAGYLAGRTTQIRQDLVTAAETRATATAQLAQIQDKLKTLPVELDALRAQGAGDVVAERERLAKASAIERERLLAHTRREIDMQVRMAHRALIERGAELTVEIARSRIVQSITPEDQLRLVDRYAAQLKEAR